MVCQVNIRHAFSLYEYRDSIALSNGGHNMDNNMEPSFSFTYDSFRCYPVSRSDCKVTAVTAG